MIKILKFSFRIFILLLTVLPCVVGLVYLVNLLKLSPLASNLITILLFGIEWKVLFLRSDLMKWVIDKK